MSWAEVKHSINSTLGTEDFKPLDKIITGQKRFIPSDTTIVILSKNKQITGSSYNIIGKFMPFIDGTIKVSLSLTSGQYYSTDVRISVLKDETETESFAADSSQIEFELNVSTDSVYEFKVKRKSSSATTGTTVENCSVKAQITDYNYFSYEEI